VNVHAIKAAYRPIPGVARPTKLQSNGVYHSDVLPAGIGMTCFEGDIGVVSGKRLLLLDLLL
jgi:hypothetical protein